MSVIYTKYINYYNDVSYMNYISLPVNCLPEEAGDEMSRGNCGAPAAHLAPAPRWDMFIWMKKK